MSSAADGIRGLGLDYTEEVGERIEAYLDELELWNRRLNLVKATPDALVTHHLLDSLAGLPMIRALPHETVADIGSGAGFPGIPLALFLPDASFVLVERSSRRAGFLRNVVTLLELRERVRVVECDLADLRERYPVVTFRAFRSLPEFAPALLEAVLPGGAIVAFKGRRASVEREIGEIGPIVASWELHPVSVPGLGEERVILILRPKAAATGGDAGGGASAPLSR